MSPSLFLAAALLPGQTIAGVRAPSVLTQPVVEAPSPPSSASPPSPREREAPQVELQPEQESDSSVEAGSERWLLMNFLQGTSFGTALDSCRTEVTGWTALG